jgi:hypothetical protein
MVPSGGYKLEQLLSGQDRIDDPFQILFLDFKTSAQIILPWYFN